MSFADQGRALLGNGYLIIPIKPGHKRPAIDQWQTSRLGAGDLAKYPGCGVGVLCGQGAHPIAAFDVDTLDAGLAARFVRWCHDRLGTTCERIGLAPKILLPYRAAEEGWGKATGAWFEGHHRLEILGRGQQFVAYAIHPDTGKPYEWVDLLGGLEYVRADELPVVTEAQVAEALQVFEAMALEAGLVRLSPGRAAGVTSRAEHDPLLEHSPPVGLALTEAKRLLAHIDNEDYDTWLRAGMALHHEYEGSDEALGLWDGWSASAASYVSTEDLETRWRSFGRSGVTARWLLKVGRANAKVAVRAELDDAKALITGCSDSIDLVADVARRAAAAAGSDIAMRAELAGLIRERFKALTGTTLSVADVRAAMAGGKKPPQFKRQLTEFGNAERLLDAYGEGLMYVPELDGWFNWTGIYWRRAAGVELEHLAKETIRALPDELKDMGDDDRAAFYKFAAVSQQARMVTNMVKLAQSDPRVVVSADDLDHHKHLLGVGNGAVDLRTGRLVAPSQSHRITTITGVEYSADAACPLFEQTVADVFSDDAEMIGFFQRLVGYTLLADPKEDVLVIPYGSGSNGKSTVLGAIREALGCHAKMASSDTFLVTGGSTSAGQAREDVLRLRGSRFVYISEPDEGSELREGLIKSMTGGEAMPARGLWSKSTIEVEPTWVAWMPTNHRPIVKGDDHAIWRRLLPVPFLRNFEGIKDTGRADRLRLELPGILAWCVRGALAYQKDGLRPPGSVRQAREDYKSDMDLLAEWLDECCEVGPGLVESNSRLWASWEGFARGRGELRFISNAKSLGRRLQAKGMRGTKNEYGLRGRGFAGIKVRLVEL